MSTQVSRESVGESHKRKEDTVLENEAKRAKGEGIFLFIAGCTFSHSLSKLHPLLQLPL